jgi:uncharacterized protein HemY
LEDGVIADPNSRPLRIALATMFRDLGRPREALDALPVEAIRANLEGLCLYVELAVGSDAWTEALPTVKAAVGDASILPAATRLQLGQIYENNGELRTAERLYATVDEGPLTWGVFARLRYKQLSFEEALRFQRKHVSAAGSTTPDEWMFLGEIFEAMGDPARAQKAFEQSLRVLQGLIPDLSGLGDPEGVVIR